MVDLTRIFGIYGVRNVTTSVRRSTEHDVFCDPVPQQHAPTLTRHRTPDSSLGMVTVLRARVRFPPDTGHSISTASRYNVGTTQLCNPGLVSFKLKGGRISICTHWKGWGELESLKGCYLQTTNYADRLNDKVACRAEFNKTQRMVGSPLAVLRDESQCLNIIGWGQMVRR